MKRLSSIVTKSDVQAHVGDVELANSMVHAYAIDLHDDISIILNCSGSNVVASWGLNPHPEKKSIMLPYVNFRRVHVKPSFRMAFRKHRAVAALDSFYAWHKDHGVPFRVKKENGEPMFVPCVYFQLEDDRFACTLITRPSHDTLAPVADFEPLVFTKGETKSWLSDLNVTEAIQILTTNRPQAFDKYRAPNQSMVKGYNDRALHSKVSEELTLFK